MRLNISTDIIPIGEFKKQMTRWLKTAKTTGRPLIITQNGKPAAVVLSPEEFDKMEYTRHFMQSVNQGIRDVSSGDVFDTEQLKNELKKVRASRESF